MKFKIKKPEKLDEPVYKTLYIKKSLTNQIDRIALTNDTSFNNVVVSMITSCLSDETQEERDT